MEIADAHMHVGDLIDASPYFGTEAPPFDMDRDIAGRVRAMEHWGVAWAVVQPSHGYLRPEGIRDTMRVNDRMAAYRDRDPRHFPLACGVVEPMHGARSLDELVRMKHELRLDGVSWHHRFSGCTIDSKWMWPILEKMRELGLAPVIHCNPESHFEAPWQLQRLARDFPDMEFLALDAFYAYERGNFLLALAADTPNVVWDIGGLISYVTCAQWVKRNGSKTICFSGVASYPLPEGAAPKKPRLFDELERSGLGEAEKADILAGNLRRVFRRT